VDRRRVRIVHAGAAERGRVAAELDAFRDEVLALEATEAEADPELDTECEVPDRDDAERLEAIP